MDEWGQLRTDKGSVPIRVIWEAFRTLPAQSFCPLLWPRVRQWMQKHQFQPTLVQTNMHLMLSILQSNFSIIISLNPHSSSMTQILIFFFFFLMGSRISLKVTQCIGSKLRTDPVDPLNSGVSLLSAPSHLLQWNRLWVSWKLVT